MAQGESKAKKSKVCNYELCAKPRGKAKGEQPLVFQIVSQLISSKPERHGHLKDAEIGVMWHLNQDEDASGGRRFGKVKILSEFDREMEHGNTDAMLVIDKNWWDSADRTERERLGLVNHLLCQIEKRCNAEGEQKKDERGRLLWIKRRPDIAIFKEDVLEGAWNDAQQDIYATVIEFAESLFEEKPENAKPALAHAA